MHGISRRTGGIDVVALDRAVAVAGHHEEHIGIAIGIWETERIGSARSKNGHGGEGNGQRRAVRHGGVGGIKAPFAGDHASDHLRGSKSPTALLNIALEAIKCDGAAAYRIVAASGGALLRFKETEHLHHHDNAEHADNHGHHDLDEAETTGIR